MYRWFSELLSPQRVEFQCGLLDLYIPLQLRFLGSSLEDLAHKDCHSQRDSESKVNNPANLGSLTNLTKEAVHSKLLVSLPLLGSEPREAAGVLCRTLKRTDSTIHDYRLQLNNEGSTSNEFLLLVTSNHPAFSFHQKQVLCQELTQIQSSLNNGGGGGGGGIKSVPGPSGALPTCSACHRMLPRTETSVKGL